jgi:acetyl esterase
MARTPQVVLKPAAPGVEVTTVRYDGAVHDCMLLDTHAVRAATAEAAAVLRAALGNG